MKTKLIAVVGPTGTGKSDLAIHLAQTLAANGVRAEIVNADSMQLYRGMDIGTAKLPPDERGGVEHHLLDVLDVSEESTAAAYQEIARPLIEKLQDEGVVPILVGGSMLYLAAVLNIFEFSARDSDLRANLEAELEAEGVAAMYQKLQALDRATASRIDPLNPRRVVRALEVVTLTGEPFAAELPKEIDSWQPVLEIGLNSDRAHLVQRLAKRVENMWQRGIVEEAEGLLDEGLRESKTASVAIGYSQALAQLDGLLSEVEAIEQTTRLTQRYARRQMSWFRRDSRIQWLDYQDPELTSKAEALLLSTLGE
ncbi:MAG: tRNA (adenosine(37)-N6)-dimethylallyltransferase MiaA [Actinomycetes bacterium]